MSKPQFSYYTTSELALAATAPKLSTKTRIQMLDEIKRREAVDEIWDNARKIAKYQIAEAMFTSMPDVFPSTNPYAKDDWRHDEWEAAHEHYIMTGLGY